MGLSEDEHGAGHGRVEADPLEEQTQPMSTESGEPASRRSPSDGAAEQSSQDPETTILSPAQGPPPLIDETPTVVLPEDEPSPESAPEPESQGDRALEPERASEAPRELEPAAEPEASRESEEAEAEESTERIRAMNPGEAATALSAAAEAATVVGEAPSRSSLAPSSSLHPMLLERIEPSLGRGERMRLDAAHWRVRLGRAESNDIRLYTASASREHAEIAGNEAGEWILTPGEGKTVLIDGDPIVEPIALEVGMNLVMGSDQLRCVTEGLERGEMSAQTSADGLEDAAQGGRTRLAGIGLSWWLIAAVALAGVGLIAFAWFGG